MAVNIEKKRNLFQYQQKLVELGKRVIDDRYGIEEKENAEADKLVKEFKRIRKKIEKEIKRTINSYKEYELENWLDLEELEQTILKLEVKRKEVIHEIAKYNMRRVNKEESKQEDER